MREFMKKLSVIMIMAMILTLIPGAGAREIGARAAEAVEGPLKVVNQGAGRDLYRGLENGVAFRASFSTATAANAYRDLANSDPEDVVKVEIVGDPAGVSIRYWEEKEGGTAWFDQGEDGKIVHGDHLNLGYLVVVGEDAPDSVTIRTTFLNQPNETAYESKYQIKDVPAAKKITVSGRTRVEVGKTTRLALTPDNPDVFGFLAKDWSDRKNDPERKRPDEWKTVWYYYDGTETTQYIEIVGLKEGTSTYEFWVDGSEEETKTTVTITVVPRTMRLNSSDIEICAGESGEVSIRDIGSSDIWYNGMETEEDKDEWLQWYESGKEPVFTISDETVAELVYHEDHDAEDTRWYTRREIRALKEGTTKITVEWLGAKAEATLTVTGTPLQDEIGQVFDDYYGKQEEGFEGPIPLEDLNKVILPKLSELIKGKVLTERAWDSLGRLDGEYDSYFEHPQWERKESETTAGLFDNVEYYIGNMTLTENRDPNSRFWVIMDDAAASALNTVSGTDKSGFTISFAEGTNEEALTPINTLKIPVRLTLSLPDDLVDVDEDDLAVYCVTGSGAKRLARGAVVKNGGSILVQIDQPGTYVMAKAYRSSGGTITGGSSSSGVRRPIAESTPAAGWVQNTVGWWYRYSDGTWPADKWAQLTYNGRTDWYHFDANGYMQTGWFTDTDGRVYYLNPVSDGWLGSMFVGSHVIDGKTYYFNETSDGYKGALVK